eukprot:TRINITY_DN2059_c0_g1_i4.p1 TRINITY_DN2059_c0_g1~~TRINITY_DN2059_c0_g1_i4.p1  ORF type:complete len:438 (+),score=96.97 TRINITY_DN2059_c0_g1_i4:787-2100(+)
MFPNTIVRNTQPMQQIQPTYDAYNRAVAEADSFLNVNNLPLEQMVQQMPMYQETHFPLLSSSPPQVSECILPIPPTMPTMKSQMKMHFQPHSPPNPPIEEPSNVTQMMIPMPARDEMIGKMVQPKPETKEEPTHFFELLYQPNEKQRKSYKNENRYILPNPLTIVMSKHMKEKKIKVDKGSVTVSLLYDTCEELEENREHILDGVKTRALDKEKKAQFHLKVVETSDRNRFRLQFVVRFWVNKVEHTEKIISHCFRVTSNKKSASIERPRPFAIKPCEGSASEETEVWIRGKLFTDRANTSVTFGGREAKVIETEDNILVCYAPIRDDLLEDETVQVKITNHKGDQSESFDASKLLEFTYHVDNPSSRRGVKREIGMVTDYNEQEPLSKEQCTENNFLYIPESPSAYPQLDDIVKNETELIDRLGYFFPSYFPTEAN